GSGLKSISTSLEQKSTSELVGDVTRLAREHPVAYLGGAMLIGVALSRFAVASGHDGGHSDAHAVQAPPAARPATGPSPATERPYGR
ncbi:MAG: hypothetical protein AB7F78_23155, partial [Hyphomicrobiaceae bacterium]